MAAAWCIGAVGCAGPAEQGQVGPYDLGAARGDLARADGGARDLATARDLASEPEAGADLAVTDLATPDLVNAEARDLAGA